MTNQRNIAFCQRRRTERGSVPLCVVLAAVILQWSTPPLAAQQASDVPGWARSVPDVQAVVELGRDRSDFEPVVVRYDEDRSALLRRWDVPFSERRRARLRDFYDGWLEALAASDFDGLDRGGQVDYVLLRNRIDFELEELRLEEAALARMEPLLRPFRASVTRLQERQRDRLPVETRASADTLARVAREVAALTARLGVGPDPLDGAGGSGDGPDGLDGAGAADAADPGAPHGIAPVDAARAAALTGQLRGVLEDWYDFYAGYDPDFTWWAAEPYDALDQALDAHADRIRAVWRTEEGPVVGDPLGAEGLEAHLAHEMIPYTADELIAIAEEEFAWMEEALVEASREMGYGDDWKAAQEAVKQRAVPPGEKPGVVLELHRQSVDFVGDRDWLTLPPLANEIWRMEMMSPQRQLTAPFFLGGEVIRISYPTDGMPHEAKLMSMRGNNPHFNRATVHHELIPGHHLQGFMTDRFNRHREIFDTPFWTEGWALYWEMVLWDAGFPRGPEDEIGMLFWRMHRAARIIFSLSFHLERMTPQEAVDFLVDRVGHERANAEAEVRRSFEGSYPPLYQAGYMLGGMQIRALHDEVVGSGRMTERDFHDAVLRAGRMPIEMLRALLTDQELERDHRAGWRFAG